MHSIIETFALKTYGRRYTSIIFNIPRQGLPAFNLPIVRRVYWCSCVCILNENVYGMHSQSRLNGTNIGSICYRCQNIMPVIIIASSIQFMVHKGVFLSSITMFVIARTSVHKTIGLASHFWICRSSSSSGLSGVLSPNIAKLTTLQ